MTWKGGLLGLVCALGVVAASDEEALDPSRVCAVDLSDAYRRAAPSYVKVQITHRPEADDPEEGMVPTVVSGFVIDDGGHIVTVGDPIQRAHMVVVETVDSRIALAQVVGIDRQSNLAVLRVDEDLAEAPELGDTDRLRPGQPVIAIGNPFDLGATLSAGYITGLDRRLEANDHDWAGLVQLSLPVYPGEQGGPLVDAHGRVVGMVVTRLEGEQGTPVPIHVSFGLPIEKAVQTSKEIIARSNILRERREVPFLGVRAVEVVDPVIFAQTRIEPGHGCVIKQVFPDTPAERAGLMAHDVLKEFDGERLRGVYGLGEAIRRCSRTQQVRVIVIRGGTELQLEVDLTVDD